MTEAPADWTEGRPGLVVQSCSACSNRWYFRRSFCPHCGSADVAVSPSAGCGAVHAVTLVERAPSPEWRALAPYGLALVDLDEGVRAMVHADPALRIGDRVRIIFREGPAGVIPFAQATDTPNGAAP